MQGSLWQWLVWNRNSRQGCWSDTPGMMCRADNHSKVRWTGNRAGKVAEEGALPEPHSAGRLSAGSACRITITLNPITSGGQLVLHLVQLLATATPAVPVSPSGAGVLPHAEQAVLGGMQHLALLPQWLGVHAGRLEDPLPVHPTVHAAPVAVPNSSSAWWRGSNCRRCACPPPSARRWASLSSLRRTGCGRRLGRAAAAALPLLQKEVPPTY